MTRRRRLSPNKTSHQHVPLLKAEDGLVACVLISRFFCRKPGHLPAGLHGALHIGRVRVADVEEGLRRRPSRRRRVGEDLRMWFHVADLFTDDEHLGAIAQLRKPVELGVLDFGEPVGEDPDGEVVGQGEEGAFGTSVGSPALAVIHGLVQPVTIINGAPVGPNDTSDASQ